MPFIISPLMPFPDILWWLRASAAGSVYFDTAEPFRKMTCRNRYYIAGAQGRTRLTIPLAHGRDQRIPVAEVRIFNGDRWQTQHWRTLTAAYRRAPFFDFYEESLQPLFGTRYGLLADFSLATCAWLQEQLQLPLRLIHGQPLPEQAPAADLRHYRQDPPAAAETFPRYQQVFAERTGFIPNLSILDLLFAEGPRTRAWIQEHHNYPSSPPGPQP